MHHLTINVVKLFQAACLSYLNHNTGSKKPSRVIKKIELKLENLEKLKLLKEDKYLEHSENALLKIFNS